MILILISLIYFFPLQSVEDNTLIVGTNAEFPPFCYIQNKEIVGFDIDVAKEVAKRLGRPIEVKDIPFDALIPDIILGRVDFVAAGMSYTKERAKRVLFTKPYLNEDPFVILTKSKRNLSMKELKGKNVVVVEGFTADLMMSPLPDINLIRLPTQSDGFMAVINGRADAFVTAKSTVDAFLETQDASQFDMTILNGSGETCALVVSKTKPKLLALIQEALDEMESDGTMTRLKNEWSLK